VQSLAVKPASIASGGSADSSLVACFIDAASHSITKQWIWLLVLLIIAIAVCKRVQRSGFKEFIKSGV
jgi:hypothetical protein